MISPCKWRKTWRSQGEVVPEALDANVKLVLTMADQKELEKFRAPGPAGNLGSQK